MKVIKKIKIIRDTFRKRPKLELLLKIATVLYSSSMIFSVVMATFLIDTLSRVMNTKYFNEFTLMMMVLLIMDFFTSILISKYIGQYLVNMNRVAIDKTGEKKMKDSAIIRTVIYSQVFFLFSGTLIISIGGMLLALLWIILFIMFIKLLIFISVSVAWLLAL